MSHGCGGQASQYRQEVEERRCSYQLGQLNCQDMCSDSLNWMEELAGSVLQDREGPSEEIES